MQAHPPLGGMEWLELVGFAVLSVLVALSLLHCARLRGAVSSPSVDLPTGRARWLTLPEIQLLTLALPLELLWEIAQFPLYTVWHEGGWGYILYGLVHCTLGDLIILLLVFWLVSLVKRKRYWYRAPGLSATALFTIAGAAYTVFSEIWNVRVKGTWGYTELMPVVPVIEIGGTPFLQWLLIPPVLVWLMWLYSQIVIIRSGDRDG